MPCLRAIKCACFSRSAIALDFLFQSVLYKKEGNNANHEYVATTELMKELPIETMKKSGPTELVHNLNLIMLFSGFRLRDAFSLRSTLRKASHGLGYIM